MYLIKTYYIKSDFNKRKKVTLIGNSSLDPSGKVLYCMKTIFPTSNPLMKYSMLGPMFPPPAQTSSRQNKKYKKKKHLFLIYNLYIIQCYKMIIFI